MWKLLIILILTSCVSLPNPYDRANCTAYGVYLGETLDPIQEIVVLSTSDLQKTCTGDIGSSHRFAGCIKADYGNGTTTVYYQDGDVAAKNHEIAHSVCGLKHTVRYLKDVFNNHPAPYFPIK